MSKFTFKTTQPTGKWKAFEEPVHNIKLNGKQCGSIDHNAPHYIRLQIVKADPMEDKNPNCPWKWITINKKSDSVEDAKKWLAAQSAAVQAKWSIYLEDE